MPSWGEHARLGLACYTGRHTGLRAGVRFGAVGWDTLLVLSYTIYYSTCLDQLCVGLAYMLL